MYVLRIETNQQAYLKVPPLSHILPVVDSINNVCVCICVCYVIR